MVTSSSMQQPSRRPAVRDIERAWRGDRCVNANDGVVRFQTWYARTRELEIGNLGLAISSMRSLRRVYEVMGMSAPAWSTPKEPSALVDPLLREYADHLRCQRGNP